MEHTVATADEVRSIVRSMDDLDVDLNITIAPNCALGAIPGLFEVTSMEGGGHGTLKNPELLVVKDEALGFCLCKIDRLSTWCRRATKILVDLDKEIEKLEITLENGGPGVRLGYKHRPYKGETGFIDISPNEDDEDLHQLKVKAQIEASCPGSSDESDVSDDSDDEYNSVEGCRSREEDEQRDVAHFNLQLLRVKRDSLAAIINVLEPGTQELTKNFIYNGTHLGSSSADFVRFRDVLIPGEDA